MWLRWVCGLSLRAAISSIIRWRSGLMVLVSLMGSSFLSEVCDTSILRAGLSTHYWGPLSWLRASRLLHPRSGLERSDFVLWPMGDESEEPNWVRYPRLSRRARGIIKHRVHDACRRASTTAVSVLACALCARRIPCFPVPKCIFPCAGGFFCLLR